MQWASGFFFFFFFFFFFLSVFRQFSFHIICIYDILYIIYDLNCRKCWGCADIDNQAMASITSSTFHHSLILINNNSSNRTKKSFSHPPSEAGFPHLLSSSSNSGKLRSLPFSSSSSSSSPSLASSSIVFSHFLSSSGRNRKLGSLSSSSSFSPVFSHVLSSLCNIGNLRKLSLSSSYSSSIICRSASTNTQDISESASMNNNEELNEGIAKFYDASSRLWEDMWGEHMHHGFYEPGLPLFSALSADHRAAQVRMIEESLRWASIPGNNIFFVSSLCHLCLGLGLGLG